MEKICNGYSVEANLFDKEKVRPRQELLDYICVKIPADKVSIKKITLLEITDFMRRIGVNEPNVEVTFSDSIVPSTDGWTSIVAFSLSDYKKFFEF